VCVKEHNKKLKKKTKKNKNLNNSIFTKLKENYVVCKLSCKSIITVFSDPRSQAKVKKRIRKRS
jgi:hypothetical protein